MVGYWVEVWTRPGAANFGRVIDGPPFRDASYHIGVGLIGDGSMTLPDTYDRFDEILDILNEVGSLVRIREDDTGSVVGEWIPSAIFPVAAKGDPFVQVSGNGMNEIMEYAITEAFDWDGSPGFISTFPDWVWGGENKAQNGGLEDSRATATVYLLTITATSGTLRITDGTDQTDPPFDDGVGVNQFDDIAGQIDNFMEADLGSITDVVVYRRILNPPTYHIELVDPPFLASPFVLALVTSGLVGGTATLATETAGSLSPAPWTPAAPLAQGVTFDPSALTTFEVSAAQAHSGSFSLLYDPKPPGPISGRMPGVQQVVNMTPGAPFRVSVWIRPTTTGDLLQLNVKTPGEEFLGRTTVQSYAINTWHQLELTGMTVPEEWDRIIVRVQSVDPFPGDGGPVYVDDLEVREGLPPATIGEVIRVLYEDACVDHVGDGRIVWEDEANPGTPYLTLDFSDTLDSSGAAWVNTEVQIRVWMRMSYLQVLEILESQEGIEWRVVPDDAEAGTWLLQVYQEGNMDAAPNVAIQGGSHDTRRVLRRLRPATSFMVEGGTRVTYRTASASGFGRIEAARLDRSLPAEVDPVSRAAEQDKANATLIDDVWSYELVDPQDAPLVAYTYGDTVMVHDPPEVDDEGRVWEMNLSLSPAAVSVDVDIIKPEAGS